MSADRWEIYRDEQRKWRWRRVAPNGRIVGGSTQGYRWRVSCVRNAKRNGYGNTL